METLTQHRSVEEIFNDILKNEPQLVRAFTPQNGIEQREAFLDEEIDTPRHIYDELESIDFEEKDAALERLGQELANSPDVNPKYIDVYETFIQGYRDKNKLMQLATFLNKDDLSEEARTQVEQQYMELNIKLFGEPKKEIYESFISEIYSAVEDKQLTGRAKIIQDELLVMLPEVTTEGTQRAVPDEETIRSVQEVALLLYGDMLRHIPEDQEKFDPHDIATVFRDTIREEFAKSADGWRVEVKPANSINVVAGEKVIIIPDDRKPVSREQLKGLVVHELGVHMLRAVTGGQTDLLPMQLGLPDYYDAEEGLCKVMQQAVAGKYTDSGVNYYVVAGLMYHGNKSFRETYELLWRRNILKGVSTDQDISQESIDGAQEKAYKIVRRIARGTDTLPLFKDLAYYHGLIKMWEYVARVKDDETLFQFLLLGKGDPTNEDHMRTMYETKSV